MKEPRARALMIQGTASGVGKSAVVTALCRLFRREGNRVAPFKAVNMSLNAGVTASGGEMGRAQIVQAEAAGVFPDVRMNPILLKPVAGEGMQVIARGAAVGLLTADEFVARRAWTWDLIADAYRELAATHELLILEGMGGPAEVNLRETDLANMRVAALAEAPVLLVADMAFGGAFAALLGTFLLLPPEEQDRVAGFVLNRYAGDRSLLTPAIEDLERRTTRPVLGVLPWQAELALPEEDSASLRDPGRGRAAQLRVGIAWLPHLSNFDEFGPLTREPDVAVTYLRVPEEVPRCDAVILPGSRATAADLAHLRRCRMAEAIRTFAEEGGHVVGICGGYQMLGRRLRDPDGVEGKGETEGLNFLPVETVFAVEKVARPIRVSAGPLFGPGGPDGIVGYEIHHGCVRVEPGTSPALLTASGEAEGARTQDGRAWGSAVHGLFQDDHFRRAWLNTLRAGRGLPPLPPRTEDREVIFDAWADCVKAHSEWPRIRRLALGQ
ncbi:MAG: cobyric acid synthase [candidate division NC10 bacterium]|nr:cobyric acid synthase [candidate division NC10 bacterium]